MWLEFYRDRGIILARRAARQERECYESYRYAKNYDFSDSVPNPYAQKLKKQITIRLEEETIDYFKTMAEEKGIPYQSLINMYLRDCAQSHRDLKLEWQ